MMSVRRRRTRFDADRTLERNVVMTAAGLTMSGRQTVTRKRYTTLTRLSDEMLDEANSIVRLPPDDRIRRRGGLAKNDPKHPFTRSNPSVYPVYKMSLFISPPEHIRGRLSIKISSKHYRADNVEHGNDGGAEVVKRKTGGRMYKIPITRKKQLELLRVRNMPLKQRRAAGWPSASVEYQRLYSRKKSVAASEKRLKERMRSNKPLSSDAYARKRRIISRRRDNVMQQEATMRVGLSRKRRVWVWDTNSRVPADRAYMMSEQFTTYSEYSILRRAMDRIAIRYFERG